MVKNVNAPQTTDTSYLVEKADYDREFSETVKEILDHNRCKYIITQEFNKLTADNFAARLSLENLASKNDIADFVIKKDFDEKLIMLIKNATFLTDHRICQYFNQFLKFS